jgi:DNA adenine methylase
MKTFIRWKGNKTAHINKFIEFIPEITGTYIEPFLGSGALLLKLEPKKWIINDINKDLFYVWKCVKNNPQDIIDGFKKFGLKFKKLSNTDKINYCKENTLKIETLPYSTKRTIQYLLMKFCSFTGDIIVNNKFVFAGLDQNIYIKNYYPFLSNGTFENLLQVSSFLNKSGKIYNKSYESILELAKENDFVFLDPPYIEERIYRFNYNKGEILNKNFITDLKIQIEKLDKKNVKWLMTQADTKEIRNIFKKYTIKTFPVYRMSSKSYTNELIIFNYKI